MTLAAPLFAWLAVAASALTTVLHLLAWRRPPESPLPTARFAPEAPIRTVSRALRPSDVLLLMLRVVLLLLVGLALAGPTFTSRMREPGRVLVIDQSRYAADSAVTRAARGEFRAGDAVVVFDSAAREVSSATPDSLPVGATTPTGDGSLSAALIVATRAARRLERGRDSVEIVVISPVATSELDAATSAIRRTWQGAVRVVRAGTPPNDSLPSARPVVRAAAGDPVAAALALGGQSRGGGTVRLVRDVPTRADSAWARQGNALVVWPATDSVTGDWPARASVDSAFGVTAPKRVGRDGGWSATVVARFERRTAPPPGRVVARWDDGEPSATEAALGSGCIRSVAIAVPAAGDLALTPTFRRLAERLATRCEATEGWTAASDSVLAATLPSSNSHAGGRQVALAVTGPPSRVTVWLLAAAMLAALGELVLRRGSNATG